MIWRRGTDVSEIDPLVERVDALLKRHQNPPSPTPAPSASLQEALLDFDPVPPAAEIPLPESDDDIPVLTEVVDLADTPQEPEPSPPPAPEPVPPPALDRAALAAEIENAVLEKLLAELDRSLEFRLNRSIGDLLDQVLDGLRAELIASVRESVREAVKQAAAKQRGAGSRPL